MKLVKKSFNVDADLAQQVDDYVRENPGASFTLVMNQALRQWVKSGGKVELQRRAATEADVDRFMKDNKDLMDDLAR